MLDERPDTAPPADAAPMPVGLLGALLAFFGIVPAAPIRANRIFFAVLLLATGAVILLGRSRFGGVPWWLVPQAVVTGLGLGVGTVWLLDRGGAEE